MLDFKFNFKRDDLKILQMTDMQIIDGAQCRYPTRLTDHGKAECQISHAYRMAFSYMDELVERTKPDLIILTGDLVYGEFDDNGTVFELFVKEMDKYNIPWAPIWGNHDNESEKGVKWQSEQFENAKNCIFKYRVLEGTSNYNIGLYNKNGELIRIIYMLDSNGCTYASDLSLKFGAVKNGIIGEKTRKWFIDSYNDTIKSEEKTVPTFACFHMQPIDFSEGLIKKGYVAPIQNYENPDPSKFVPFVGKGEDFGGVDNLDPEIIPPVLPDFKKINVDGIFMGHEHKNNLSVMLDGIRWTYGLKTGTYDSHRPDRLGGTLITVKGNGEFTVEHQYQKKKTY